MTTYSFADKNSSCVLLLSADDEAEALAELQSKVSHPDNWRMEVLEDEDYGKM